MYTSILDFSLIGEGKKCHGPKYIAQEKVKLPSDCSKLCEDYVHFVMGLKGTGGCVGTSCECWCMEETNQKCQVQDHSNYAVYKHNSVSGG